MKHSVTQFPVTRLTDRGWDCLLYWETFCNVAISAPSIQQLLYQLHSSLYTRNFPSAERHCCDRQCCILWWMEFGIDGFEVDIFWPETDCGWLPTYRSSLWDYLTSLFISSLSLYLSLSLSLSLYIYIYIYIYIHTHTHTHTHTHIALGQANFDIILYSNKQL